MNLAEFFFEQVEVVRMPGFPSGKGFTVSGLCPGVNILYGPNASGKTTLCRAIQLLLHGPKTLAPEYQSQAQVEAQVQLRQNSWRVHYSGSENESRPVWQRMDQADAQAEPPLHVSPEHHRHYLLELPNLLAADEKGEDLVQAILRELSGGYDLQKAYEILQFQPRHSGKGNKTRDLENARQKVRNLQQVQEQLFSRQADLQDLRRRLQEAEEASRQVNRLQKALDLLKAQAECDQARARVESFPSGLERMTGEESDRLQNIHKALQAKAEEKRHLNQQLEDISEEIASLALPQDGISRTDLSTLRSQVNQLKRLEDQMRTARQANEEAIAQVAEARNVLGRWVEESVAGGTLKIDLEGIQQLAKWGRDLEQFRADQQASQTLRQWLEELFDVSGAGTALRQFADRLRQQTDALRRAGEAIQRWLNADEQFSHQKEQRTRQRTIFGVAAAGVAGLAIVLALLVHPSWWLLLLAAVGLLTAALWPDSQSDPRTSYQKELESLRSQGVPLPSAWEVTAVRQSWAQVHQRIAQCELQVQAALRWADLEPKITQLQNQQTQIEHSKQQLAQTMGFSPKTAEQDPTWLSVLAEAVRSLHQAQQAQSAAQASLQSLQAETDELARKLTTVLREYGFQETKDSDCLEAQVAELEKRQERHTSLSNQQQQSARDKERIEQDIQKLQQERRELLQRFGLGEEDEAKLYTWTEMLPDYRQCLVKRQNAEGALGAAQLAWKTVAHRSSEEQSDEEIPPVPGSQTDIEAELNKCKALADKLSELAKQVGELENEIAQAKLKNDLETALANLAYCRAELEQQRQKDYETVVGHVLVQWLQESERRVPQHPVLQQGGELFAQFTGGRYQWDPGSASWATQKTTRKNRSNTSIGLMAKDTQQNTLLPLDALSSGTRVQLLVAARMAFVQYMEDTSIQPPGIRLPIFLDETLANSDDQRACQIIQAALHLAQQGRQIFYLTAQQDELAKWQSALENWAPADPKQKIPWKILNLAEIRRLQ